MLLLAQVDEEQAQAVPRLPGGVQHPGHAVLAVGVGVVQGVRHPSPVEVGVVVVAQGDLAGLHLQGGEHAAVGQEVVGEARARGGQVAQEGALLLVVGAVGGMIPLEPLEGPHPPVVELTHALHAGEALGGGGLVVELEDAPPQRHARGHPVEDVADPGGDLAAAVQGDRRVLVVDVGEDRHGLLLVPERQPPQEAGLVGAHEAAAVARLIEVEGVDQALVHQLHAEGDVAPAGLGQPLARAPVERAVGVVHPAPPARRMRVGGVGAGELPVGRRGVPVARVGPELLDDLDAAAGVELPPEVRAGTRLRPRLGPVGGREAGDLLPPLGGEEVGLVIRVEGREAVPALANGAQVLGVELVLVGVAVGAEAPELLPVVARDVEDRRADDVVVGPVPGGLVDAGRGAEGGQPDLLEEPARPAILGPVAVGPLAGAPVGGVRPVAVEVGRLVPVSRGVGPDDEVEAQVHARAGPLVPVAVAPLHGQATVGDGHGHQLLGGVGIEGREEEAAPALRVVVDELVGHPGVGLGVLLAGQGVEREVQRAGGVPHQDAPDEGVHQHVVLGALAQGGQGPEAREGQVDDRLLARVDHLAPEARRGPLRGELGLDHDRDVGLAVPPEPERLHPLLPLDLAAGERLRLQDAAPGQAHQHGGLGARRFRQQAQGSRQVVDGGDGAGGLVELDAEGLVGQHDALAPLRARRAGRRPLERAEERQDGGQAGWPAARAGGGRGILGAVVDHLRDSPPGSRGSGGGRVQMVRKRSGSAAMHAVQPGAPAGSRGRVHTSRPSSSYAAAISESRGSS